MNSPGETLPVSRLADVLGALANPVRLQILLELRHPRALREITVRPARKTASGRASTMSLSALRHHLDTLLAIGAIVQRPRLRDGQRVDTYQVSHPNLFALTEELRGLARIRGDDDILDGTMPVDATPVRPVHQGRRLTALNGPIEGECYALGKGTTRLGRQPDCTVWLAHDPYVSLVSAYIDVDKEARLRAVEGANPPHINWVPVTREATLRTGDVIRLGRTNLLYHEA